MIKSISKIDKILFCSLIFLTMVFVLFKINSFVFPIISLCLNMFLIIIVKEIKKILNIKFSKLQKIVMLLCVIFIYLFYFISIINRKFIYYWDYSCYYNLQVGLEESFSGGIFSGIKSFIGITWSGEYGNFLTFFPEFIFNFTNKTINSYVLSCVLIYVPYIVVSFSILLIKIMDLFKVKKQNIIYITSMFSFILFPILHATFIYGQPDIFGITFIFLIIALTINYEFKKLIKTVNAINPKAFSIVDTKGTLGQNDIQGLYKLIEDELNESISLCFHSHNNLALSFLNTKKLISLCQKRELILDCSIFGMGRGAGNLHGELLMSYLNNVYGKNYNISPLFEIIEKYINPIYKKTPWKSSLPYFLSALNRCHQDYAKYLADKENLSFEFINTLLCAIPKNKKSSYDENLIKEMYQSAHKENSLARSASIS